uniref:Uncharacterized protein n=1 Tax=Arundo donax TaxID=35708 RepID=A0A0A9D369_ARUDO
MLFVLEFASICIELSSTGSALTAFVASNNFLIESRKNLPTTSLSDMEAISLIAGCNNPIASIEDVKNMEQRTSKRCEEKARIAFKFSSATSLV